MSEQWRQLSYFAPEKIKAELFPEQYLHEEVVKTRQYFKAQEQAGDIDVTDPHVTADVFVWQYIDYLPGRPDNYYDSARGYLMVEPLDIPAAARILDTIYRERKTNGSFGQFKWLMRKLPTDLTTDEWWQEARNSEKMGLFEDLSETDPRIVLYENSPSRIQEVLAALATSPEWQALESNRLEAFPDGVPPIKGTDRFVDDLGRVWHSLSYNAKVGHSHQQ